MAGVGFGCAGAGGGGAPGAGDVAPQGRDGAGGLKPAVIWLLQTCLAALLLLMLWHPAISVATLKPQQNIVAVVVDDSRSMSISEDGKTRLERARSALDGGLIVVS